MRFIITGIIVVASLTGCDSKPEAIRPKEITASYCAANKIGAQAAAAQAALLQTHKHEATVGGATTVGCGVIAASTAWFDLGTSTIICLAAGAIIAANTQPVNDNGKAAEDAYNAFLDPRCTTT